MVVLLLTIVLPYPEAAKYYEGWAHEECMIDFKNDTEKADRCTISYAAEEICTYLKKAGLEVIEVTYQGEWVSVTARKN